MKVYLVTAYRYGDKESHSYVIGIFDNKKNSIMAAKTEENWRGGKYDCEVLEWEMNVWKHSENITKPLYKIIKGIYEN